MGGEHHIHRVQRIAKETRQFFEQGMPGVEIERIAAFAADMMAQALTGETLAATSPTPADAGEVREKVARGLYEHWVEEDFGNEYCSWDLSPDKETWFSRADAILSLLPSPPVTDRYREGIEAACVAFEQAINEGYEEVPGMGGEYCLHGTLSHEDCIACYDDTLTTKIAAIRALASGEG